MKTYTAKQKNITTNWEFTGTLEEIQACLTADNRCYIYEKDGKWIFTPNCEAWEEQEADTLYDAIKEVLGDDMHSSSLEEVKA